VTATDGRVEVAAVDGELLEPSKAGRAQLVPNAALHEQGERVAILPARVAVRDVGQVRVESDRVLRLRRRGVSEHLDAEEPALADVGEDGEHWLFSLQLLLGAAGILGGAAEEHARDEHSEGPHATVASGGLCCGRGSVLFVRRLARGADLGGVQGERSLHGRRRGKGGGSAAIVGG